MLGLGRSSHSLVFRSQWRYLFEERSSDQGVNVSMRRMRMKKGGVLFTSWQSSFEHPLEDN
jgi:hypothetical protein